MAEQDKEYTGEPAEVATPEVQSTPTGRSAFMERYRGANSDITDEPDDDTMYGWAGSQLDDLTAKYKGVNGANEKLAEVVGQDPRFAQFIAMVAGGENLMYALGKTFGNMIDELDDEAIENLRKGQEEYSARYNRVKENFSTYESTLKAYGEKNGLTPDQLSDVNNAILDIAEAINEGAIPEEVIDNVWKGLDYNTEKTTEIEAAKLSGRNEAIEDIKGKKTKAPLPDLSGARSQPKRQAPVIKNDESYKPYMDGLEVIPKK